VVDVTSSWTSVLRAAANSDLKRSADGAGGVMLLRAASVTRRKKAARGGETMWTSGSGNIGSNDHNSTSKWSASWALNATREASEGLGTVATTLRRTHEALRSG